MKFTNPAWRRRPIRTALRVAWSLVLKRRPPRHPLVVPFDEGRSRIHADLRTTFGLWLYRYGGCDHDLLFLRRFLRPGDVFVDGGAHVGLFTLVAARAVAPDGEVYSFEPAPSTFAMLRQNIKLNGIANAHLFQEALGAEAGSAAFTAFSGDRSGFSGFVAPDDRDDGVTISVAVTTLAERIPPDVWDRVSLMKLDIEGAELDALRGAEQLLKTAHPALLIEFVPEHFTRSGSDPGQLLGFLDDHGYRVLRPARDPALWEPCTGDDAFGLRPWRPNLLACADLDVVRARGVRICEAQ